MSSTTRITCKRCLMPFGDRFISKDGVCVVCDEHRKKWLHRDYQAAERELKRIMAHYRERNKNHKYDCILAFSGGKDSVYARSIFSLVSSACVHLPSPPTMNCSLLWQ